ncbi:biotin/lipoyl-binding protein, partial [Sulfurimonas sp.]|nr:biotin/lipoyl-binding protein [Sulfurimonas sp.]
MKDIAQLLQIEENCRNAQTLKELKYILVNESIQVLDYEHAILFSDERSSKLKVQNISHITTVEKSSPFTQWLEKNAKQIKKSELSSSLHTLSIHNDFTPSNLLWIPLTQFKKTKKTEFYLLLCKHNTWTEDEKKIALHLASSYSYFLYASLQCKPSKWFIKKLFSGSFKLLLLSALVLIMFFPVKLSVLAPLEIKAQNPTLITSPLNGAIEEIKVDANQVISKGDLLVKIKDTAYKNNYTLANKTLEVTKAKLHTIKQNSFMNPKEKSKIANVQAEVQLKQAEMEFAKYQYELVNIYAQKSGTVIVNDP